jgi:hypothetical protein
MRSRWVANELCSLIQIEISGRRQILSYFYNSSKPSFVWEWAIERAIYF